MEKITLIGLILITIVFVWIISKIVTAVFKSGKSVYYAACAGNPEGKMTKMVYGASMSSNTMLNEEGEKLMTDDYNIYVASGESMSLADIHDGDMLLSSKGVQLNKIELHLPDIFILKRENPKPQEPLYKVRRVWALWNVDEKPIESLLRDIMNSEKFQELKKDGGKLDLYPGEILLINDFKKRLEIYKRKHIGCDNSRNENHITVISTTLRKGENKISFSIHPAKIVVGKVCYVYEFPKKKSIFSRAS